jgi:hypothetical protein
MQRGSLCFEKLTRHGIPDSRLTGHCKKAESLVITSFGDHKRRLVSLYRSQVRHWTKDAQEIVTQSRTSRERQKFDLVLSERDRNRPVKVIIPLKSWLASLI